MAFCAFLWWRLEPIINKLLTIEERRVNILDRPPAPPEPPMPVDLYVVASGESDAWAREQAMKRMRELYAETRNWDTVRNLVLPDGA